MGAAVTRIVDLFSEGKEVFLGMDPTTHKPIVVWVNKLNSFETQEARADANARRSERMHALGQPNAPEKLGFDAEVAPLTQEMLAQRIVESKGDEIYLDVINDIETDPEWRERRDRMERLPSLLDDSGAAEDDPRRETLHQDQVDWLKAISEGQAKRQAEVLRDAMELTREELLAQLWDRYRQRETLDVFIGERKATALYFAMRECEAVDVGTSVEQPEWDHAGCDHSKRLLTERKEVYALPDPVVEKCSAALDAMTIGTRAAGNSAAPSSSSGSSEPASAEAEDSTPSTPEATSPEPPTS